MERFRSVLLSSNSESDFVDIANEFSDEILEYSNFQKVHIRFLVDLLSTHELYSKKGLFHFLAVIGVDTDIMTPEQLKEISDAITSNFADYEDEMLCITACDFIAHYYPFDEAREILSKLKAIENTKKAKGFAEDGLRTLSFIHQKGGLVY